MKVKAFVFASTQSTHDVLARCAALNIRVQVLLGKYNGILETSYAASYVDFLMVLNSGLTDGQESILLLNDTEAALYHLETKIEETLPGKPIWTPDDIEVIGKDYSYDPMVGVYLYLKTPEMIHMVV